MELPSPILHGERPGTEYDAAWWRSVYALYDECFPGLPAGIARAAAAGVPWPSFSTPFVAMEQGRAVAHVGVLAHPMILDGRPVEAAGIHAVCTTKDRRRQGLARRLLTEALSWADERFAIAKLHTDVPAVYAPHGFRAVATCRFRTPVTPAPPGRKRRLRPTTNAADAALLAARLAARVPPSNLCATADGGWVDTIVASLSGVIQSGFWLLEDFDAVVVVSREEASTLILDVIATELPPVEVVVGGATHGRLPVMWSFSPDRFHPRPQAIPAPAEAGVFMVRGDWPVREPFGLSPLWEH